MIGTPASADTCVGATGLRGGSHGEAAAVEVQAVGSIGHPSQPGKLIIHILHLTFHLSLGIHCLL